MHVDGTIPKWFNESVKLSNFFVKLKNRQLIRFLHKQKYDFQWQQSFFHFRDPRAYRLLQNQPRPHRPFHPWYCRQNDFRFHCCTVLESRKKPFGNSKQGSGMRRTCLDSGNVGKVVLFPEKNWKIRNFQNSAEFIEYFEVLGRSRKTQNASNTRKIDLILEFSDFFIFFWKKHYFSNVFRYLTMFYAFRNPVLNFRKAFFLIPTLCVVSKQLSNNFVIRCFAGPAAPVSE